MAEWVDIWEGSDASKREIAKFEKRSRKLRPDSGEGPLGQPWPTSGTVEVSNQKRREQIKKARQRRARKYKDDQWDDDDHLLIGIRCTEAEDFLATCGWPTNYTRSDADVSRNGPLEVGKGKETGYDLAKYIKNFLRQQSLQQFAIAEVLCAAWNMGCRSYARIFLSHAQAEPWLVTLRLMRRISLLASIWVDYFCLRQCLSDFDPPKIRAAIGVFGDTRAGLSILPGKKIPEMLTRVWCGYEIYSSILQKAKVHCVASHHEVLWELRDDDFYFDLAKCEATNPADKEQLMEHLNELGGVDDVNRKLHYLLDHFAKKNIMGPKGVRAPAIGLACCYCLTLILFICSLTRGIWMLLLSYFQQLWKDVDSI